MDLSKWLVENYGVISAVIGIVFGFALKFRKYIKNAVHTITLGDHFYSIFGADPAQKIKDLISEIQTCNEIAELRRRLIEKRIKLGIFICDTEGKCIWSNDFLNNMFGLDSTEMKGFGWLKSIIPSDRERVNEEWMYSIKNKTAYESDYTILNRRNADFIKVRASALAVLNDNDKIECYVGHLEELKIDSLSGHERAESIRFSVSNGPKEET